MRKYMGPIIIAVLALVLIFGGALVGFYTDWLWFSDLGYGKVFATMLLTKLELGLLFGFLFFAIIYGNLWYARKIAPPASPMGFEQQLIQRLGYLARRGIGVAIFIGSIIVSGMVGLEAATHWEEWLKYFHATSFGTLDPVFSKDIGYYVFKLPFLVYLYRWLFFALFAATVASIAIHYADEAIESFAGRIQVAPKAKAHVCVLIASMFFVAAWGYWLKMHNLVLNRGDLIDGATYTDIHARIPAYWILLAAAIIGGLLVLANSRRRGFPLIIIAVVGVIGLSLVVGAGYPAMMQWYSVKPNELEKETPYIKRAIAATRQAYGLTKVSSRAFAASPSLSAQDVEQNRTTIENIRLWDEKHLLPAYNQVQNLRQYYTFVDVDVDRYMLPKPGGGTMYRQVWLSARELSTELLPEQSQTWVNEHIQYTHGYGYVMSPVNEVDPEGAPVYFVYNIPPKTLVDIPIHRMGNYFGELTNDYVFVNTKAKEFDYPAGKTIKTTTYRGPGGIELGSFFRKLAFSVRFADVNMLLNDSIQPRSRIMYNRNMINRFKTLLPFLKYDQDPYLVTVGGDLYWMQDAYTSTDSYPYSQHLPDPSGLSDFNYMRNSVKLVGNAYTGEVTAYVIQEPLEDPIIKTYQKIFPGVFKPLSKMPKDLRAHIRYPEDMFRVQTVVYQRYHMTSPTVFYNNSDLWAIPTAAELVQGDAESQSMEPYYTIMKLPNGDTEEFILMTPYISAGKKNMVSWMCAKSDGKNYGQMVVYQFPSEKNVFGPQQIAARARQDTVISQEITLWSQQGSNVGSGNLLVIPIESSLLYVMPVYLQSTDTPIPELKRVIVALGNKIVMEPTLAEALTRVVGAPVEPTQTIGAGARPSQPGRPSGPAGPGVPTAPVSDEVKQLAQQANQQYNRAQEALRKGDWAAYGRETDALKETLSELGSKTK